jgi:type 1 fimbria pilin
VRLTKKQYLSAFAGLLAAMPVWAAHSNTINWNVTQPATIGGTQIKPGEYVLRIDDGGTQVEVVSHGKVIAQVPCQWTPLSEKSHSSEVDVDGGQVTQVKFSGKNQALSFK